MARKNYLWISASEQVREILEFRMKAERDEATRLSRARKEGREEGREEARKEGREQGLEQGRVRGTIEAAQRMLAAGFDIQTVCEALELTPEPVQSGESISEP